MNCNMLINLKCILIFSLIIFLSSCENLEYISNNSMNPNAIKNENVFELVNGLNEQYTIKYKEQIGFPDQLMKIVISDSEKKIIEYNMEYSTLYVPNQVLYLFSNNDGIDYYFISDKSYEYIAKYNKEDFQNSQPIYINRSYSDLKSIDQYITLSEIIQNGIDEELLISKFKDCDYDYDNIITLYHLSD